MRASIAALCFFIIFLAGCDRTHQNTQEKKVPWLSLCPDFSQTGKAPVEQNAQCGHFDVKENPQNPNSATIPLNILLLPAVNPVPEKDPLFIIAGGPGQSAVVVAESIHSIFNDVRKNRDIVFVDQRGTGKSNPLDCEFETEKSQQLPESEQQAFARQALAQCIDKVKDHAAYYTTNYAVADLDAVRAALGYEKINLWGGSYGSRVVLEYIRRFPAHTRASVLDGVAPVAIALPWSMEADGLASLEGLNQQCAQVPACVTSYGDIVKKAQAVSNKLVKEPKSITIPHPRTQEKINVSLSAEDFSSVIRLALYSRDLSSLIPRVISEAEAGNYELFASLIYLAKSKSDMAGISYGMHYSVVCSEDYPLYKDKNALDSNVFLNALSVQKYSEVCAQWPRGQLPADYWDSIKSDLPVLMLSGAGDPVTPPRWGELVKKDLKNASHLIVPGGHHIVTSEGCVAQLITAFIVSGDAKALDASCVQNIQPLAIHLPVSAIANTESTSSQSNDQTTLEKKE
ncbi:alpha/beta hydrolase [Cellvibrio zantedeschiae]|uniref:Proline iminopeptidase n=1 Tax=Cellvibrio zantedeschiae TaxID=1237077 RepID=A0ABQ3BAN6_9GAMM|nr:alpha/beta hydrolase [Cellvibrio zantedeschiae]GGY87206.1 alpha/beta hydrolase [Cellvibrio zantedeschiae]